MKRADDERILTASAIVAWCAAAGFGVLEHGAVAGAFVGAGTLLFIARAFYARMRGRTNLTPQGIDTDLAPVNVQGPVGDAQPQVNAELDPSTLVARWPTLADALEAIPSSWTTERIRHEDGQQYLHVRSPQSGYDLVVNVAALDSAAPQWLMVAIAVMGA